MDHHLVGPFWGNVIIIGLAGSITVVCLIAVLRMLLHPGETDQCHPKYNILRDDS
jgi:hypothetical protein